MAHFLPPEHVRQVNKLEWPKVKNQRSISINENKPYNRYMVIIVDSVWAVIMKSIKHIVWLSLQIFTASLT